MLRVGRTILLCLALVSISTSSLAAQFEVITVSRVALIRDPHNDGNYSIQFYSKRKMAKCAGRKIFAFHSRNIETIRSAHALLLGAVTTKQKVMVAFELHPSGSHCRASNITIYDYK